MKTISEPNYTQIYAAGFEAGCNGLAESNCPFVLDRRARLAWINGWVAGREAAGLEVVE